TESFLREKSLEVLAAAVLDWAWTHTGDPDFLRKSPSEVALYLLAKRSALAQVVRLGREASPHLDYTPLPDETDAPPLELVVELVVGLVPGVGDLADAKAVITGYSFTGRKLSEEEKKLALLCVMLPFISSRALSAGEGTLERVAVLTGRSLEEARVLQRVAQHLSPQDVKEVDRVLHAAAREGRLTEENLQLLERIAQRLEKPLAEAANALQQGGKVSLVGSRTNAVGARLLPGSAEHMSQAWVDYQFRHPGKYTRFTYAPDAEWQRLYRAILENKRAGGEFEQTTLKLRGYEKNTVMMMPPPSSKARGFIADSIKDNPGELVWGQPYHFVEVKGREQMAFTGNLEAMITYVETYGGYLEVWFRSAKHPKGKTQLTGPLERRLRVLAEDGKASVDYTH
ncbi:MAG TPA: pre-toxin TG domain-containing protein, partial [Hyalangium sp.]|nr:pre-toxin TG domain-containing protein [Hyalangium sp.]